MWKRALGLSGLVAAGLMMVPAGGAKDKPKNTMPSYILRARTVAVVVDPQAGVSIDDPRANQVAQKDVETALLKWGRLDPMLSTASVDLIIVVRKGSGKLVNETVNDPRQNSRPGSVTTTDNSASVGVQRGTQRGVPGGAITPETPRTQAELGNVDDSFVVYDGSAENPLDGPAGWRYVMKKGLHSHDVPAVAAFQKALEEAEKAAAKKP